MNTIISTIVNDTSELEKHGKQVYTHNPFFRDVVLFMNQPTNQSFYDKYMNKHSTLEEVLVFLHLYRYISTQKQTQKLNSLEKLALMDKILKNSEIRHQVCIKMFDWLSTNKSITQLLE